MFFENREPRLLRLEPLVQLLQLVEEHGAEQVVLDGQGQAVGQSGDGGIDGIIKEDRLGLDTIYIQAKRWENTVGRPEIQKFVGALQGHRSKKGVFITTSSFSREAKEYAGGIDTQIVLIDGEMLAALMIEFDIGVSPISTYVRKRIDTDYFDED